MPTLLIAYDLAQPAEMAAPLARVIMDLGVRWARPLASLWFVESDASPAEIENRLCGFVGMDDGLVVQQVTGEPALGNTLIRWTSRHAAAKLPKASQEKREVMVAGSAASNVIPWPEREGGIAVAA